MSLKRVENVAQNINRGLYNNNNNNKKKILMINKDNNPH